MSDPRMIPADEAKAMRELLPGDLDLAEYDMFDRMAKWLPHYRTYAAAPDLAHTVVTQAAQIERVRETRSMINRIIATAEGGVDLGDPAALAKSIVNKINDALGDTDG